MFRGAIELIKKAKRISLLVHRDAGRDGDAMGSIISLSLVLKMLDKETFPFLGEEVASNFLFTTDEKMLDSLLLTEPRRINPDLLILLDFGELKRCVFPEKLSCLIKKVPSILIDHHPLGDLSSFCRFKIHDLRAAATTELLYFLIKNMNVAINKEIANSLLLGILFDTNNFQNPNTTSRSLQVSSSLMSAGARPSVIAEHLFYQKSAKVLRLWGRAMERLWKNKKHDLLITVLREKDFQECGVDDEAAAGIINFLNLNVLSSAVGVLFLLEKDGRIKGSLRTVKEGLDISRLARVFGGGGHQKAAGFEIEGRLKKEKNNWKIV